MPLESISSNMDDRCYDGHHNLAAVVMLLLLLLLLLLMVNVQRPLTPPWPLLPLRLATAHFAVAFLRVAQQQTTALSQVHCEKDNDLPAASINTVVDGWLIVGTCLHFRL